MAQTWFITGCSTGFGRALAQHVIALGNNVVVTARDPAQVADLSAIAPDRTLALALDVTKADDIARATIAAEQRFGHIDVLVNNAGVGYFGAFEESDMDAVRAMFEVNVWGLANMTRAVLPGMRRRRSGTIVNISSVGGLRSVPSLSFYAASKFAVEALSEGLSKETEPLGIKVLIVEPGPFRTDWAGRSAGRPPSRSTTTRTRRVPSGAGSGGTAASNPAIRNGPRARSSWPSMPPNRRCDCCSAGRLWPVLGRSSMLCARISTPGQK